MIAVGFHTISEALACESYAKSHPFPGRLGPVPMFMEAGCGYAWLVEQGGNKGGEAEAAGERDAGSGNDALTVRDVEERMAAAHLEYEIIQEGN